MKKINWQKESLQKGSLMVEALALLGLITMVTPVLYKKAAERTTELQDINVATQMRMVSTAVDNFLKDNYKEIGEAHGSEAVFKLSAAEREVLDKYLPYGFSSQKSKMFKDFDISVRRREIEDSRGNKHNIYTGAVLAPLDEDVTMVRSSKIASMIGANGGVYKDGNLQGVQGTWNATLQDYDFAPADATVDELPKVGSLAVVSAQAISSAKGDVTSEEVLFRVADGDEAKNTMQTTLYMDGNPIRTVKEIIASSSGNTVYIGSSNETEASNLVVTGTTVLRKTLQVDGLSTFKDKVTITANGLDVTGSTVLQNNLNVKGATDLDGTLNVDGETTLKKTTVTGDLIQKGGKVDFTPSDFKVASDGAVTIQATTNASLTAGKNVNIEGGTQAAIKVGDKGITINSSGNTINGKTTINNGDLVVSGGNIDVQKAGASITADWLVAKTGLKVGGTTGTVLVADSGGVDVETGPLNVNSGALQVKGNEFSVGGTVDEAANKINVNDSSAFFGHSYASNGTHEGLMIKSASVVLRNAQGSLTMNSDSGALLEGTGNSRIKLKDSTATIGVGTSGSESAKVSVAKDKIGFEQKPDSTVYSMYLDSGELDVASKGLVIDQYGLALAAEGGDISTVDSVNHSGGVLDTKSILKNSKVAISRKGIIEVAAPVDSTDGFIRARRLVSDKEYPTDAVFSGYTAAGAAPTKKYDYYQVNPAYTSVMNDIKLATRGGARLSDILPDFINKGIYVVDNTYTISSAGNWEGLTITNGKATGVTECDNNACIASPWMGFVPAPQCPRAYAKAITLNPIRWRMSEVYSVIGATSWAETKPSNYATIISGSGNDASLFRQHFLKVTNPRAAGFKLDTVAGGTTHTHQIENGYPLTFQANTWLNTTVSPKYNGTAIAENALGWHAVMGFIYTPGQYGTLLTDIGQTYSATEDVFWNIFPVYAGDMATVANVYCYFDRNPLKDGNRTWTWGTDTPVYQYDQLNNYRSGNKKDATWGAAVNDPQLGYDDVW